MLNLDSLCKISKTRLIVLVLLLLLGIGLIGCSHDTPADKLEGKIRLGAYSGVEAGLVWIAKEQRYFEQVGLDVEIVPFTAGKLAADALSKDKVDIVTCADFVFVKKSFLENDLRVLGAVGASNTIWMTAHKSKGIITPGDLKGKRIGVTMGSSGEYFLGRFLASHALEFQDVHTVDMAPPKIVESMLDRSIDAAFTWNPNIYHTQQKLQDGTISFEGQGGQLFYFILLTKEGWLEAYLEHSERLIQALELAEKWIGNHTEEAFQILSETFQVDRSYLEATWEPQRTKIFFPQALLVAMNGEKRWLVRKRLVSANTSPNLKEFLSPGPMKKVKPHAVTVIK